MLREHRLALKACAAMAVDSQDRGCKSASLVLAVHCLSSLLEWVPFGDATAMLTSSWGDIAMQQARRATTRVILAIRLPALVLRSSHLAKPVPPWPRSDCSPLMLHSIRIRLHHVQPVNARTNVAGETLAEQTVMGLSTRLDCRRQLQCGQRCRSFSLACAAGAEDVCAITHLKSPWPVYPSISVLSSSHGGRSSGQIRCLSYSPVWKRSAQSANASVDSGGTQTIEQLWEEYFADASQWWDNRVDKKNPTSPDLKHKVTRKELWIDGWSTPAWVKARLTPMTQGRLQCHVGYGTRNSQDTAQGKRLRMGNNGEGNTLPTSVGERRQIVQGGGGSMHVQSASTTSEAIAILKNRLEQGIAMDSYTYVDVLKRCLKQKDLVTAKQVHDCIIKSGMDQNIYVGNNLLIVYIRCGRLEDARRVFDGLLKKDVISWNVMIGGYAQRNHANDAMEVFHQMRHENVEADEITYLSILKACGNPSALKWGKEVHAYIRNGGLESNVRVGTALLQMYAKCGCIKEARQTFDNMTNADVFSWNVMMGAYVESGNIDDARLVFDRMEERNVVTWTVMIGAYAKCGCGEEAYRLFLQMKREGFKPDVITYISILNACASAGTLDWVKEVHGHALEAGLESDLRVGNALTHMYAKCGNIDDARLVFDRMEERNVITWNVMIGAYAESGCGEEAYRFFLRMKREGFKPDAITYINILNACASAGALEWVKEVHGHALEAGLESELRVGNSLVHMYAKSGSIDDARLIFDRMEKRDVVTWNVMIGGLAQHGCGHEALERFRNMNGDGVKPDGLSLVAVLSACSHAGLLDDGRRIFLAMTQDYGIKPNTVLCNCMVDLLGRAGQLEEAMLFIGNMPVEPDGATWGALLGACRTHGNVEMAELAAKERLKLERSDAGTYVLLSNIYAAAGKWEQVSLVRTMMQERGIRKEPGRSWIEVDNKIHRFVVGDTSHPETKEIYAVLNRLNVRIKAEGYIPDTRLVLQNIDEEDKELALCSHSEKLAIAYGLMRTSRGPIRVFKNLRICSDCHAATKLISKVTGREIVARDANRFHHFKDGVCSCGDYW